MNTSTTRPGHGPLNELVSVPRALSGGFLMGLANLVPGVSGGTLILALGLYDKFIGAIADVTRFRFSRSSVLFLAWILLGAAVAILSLSGVAVGLIGSHRWIMYSLFIGLALGGVPELVPLCRPLRFSSLLSIAVGLAVMLYLAFGVSSTSIPHTLPVLLLVGALAASSMILPGISGSYILLILGMYDYVIGSLSSAELREDPVACLKVIVPVGVGAVLGVALLSNLLKYLLAKQSRISHGVLLGLLLGSVFGLYPFQKPVYADLANKSWRKAATLIVSGTSASDVAKRYGIEFSVEEARELHVRFAGQSAGDLKRLGDELEFFEPSILEVLSALGLLVLGVLLARFLGRGKPENGSLAAQS